MDLFVWWCLAPLSTIYQLYRGGQFCFVEETGGPGENPQPVEVTEKLYHIMLCTSPWSRFKLTASVVICTDYIGSCKSYYHMIMATTALLAKYAWNQSKYICCAPHFICFHIYTFYICIIIGHPIMKKGGLGSNYEEGGFGIQLWRREGWDPTMKKGGLGSNYEEGRVGIQLTGLTLPLLCVSK